MPSPLSNVTNEALVDNWLLESVAALLTQGIESDRSDDIETVSYLSTSEPTRRRRLHPERLIALLTLIDLVVLHDKIVFDPAYSRMWRRQPALAPIGHALKPCAINEADRQSLNKQRLFRGTCLPSDDIVADGASYYLALANHLGIFYWPSPLRAEFISKSVPDDLRFGFVFALFRYLDEAAIQTLREAMAPVRMIETNLRFAGFGPKILAESNDLNSVLRTAVEFRNTKGATAFRSWLGQIKQAFNNGNLLKVSQAFVEVHDLIEFVKVDLSLTELHGDAPRLTFGLSPSVSLAPKTLSRLKQHCGFMPGHLVFLRTHFEELLSTRSLKKQLERHFPRDIVAKLTRSENIYGSS